MPERPPAGYPRKDKPLPHSFSYQFALHANDDAANKAQCTFLRTSTIDVDPETIVVDPRANAFGEDTGPLICNGSRVQFISISVAMKLTEGAVATDKINALNVYSWNIHGAFEDAWTPADENTTTTIAQLLHVVSTVAQEDVVPEVTGVNITGMDHAVSNKTGAEVFGDYGLTTNLVLENTSTDTDMIGEIFDAKQYYTNGAKLNSLMGTIKRHTLTSHRQSMQTFEKKFTPRQCRSANPHMIFSRQFYVPAINNRAQIIGRGDTVTNINHVGFVVGVRFNEWNQDFEQTR